MPGWTLYMDESGSAGDRRGHYVLGCLVGNAEELARLEDRLYYLKLGMAPGKDPSSWEIHSNKIMTGYSPIGARTPQKRLAVLKAVVETVCRSDVTLFGVAVVNELIRRNDNGDGVHHALTFVLERFELFLRTRGGEETGQIVSDMMRLGTRKNADRVFTATKHGHNRLSDIRIESIAGMKYVSSRSSPLTQVADVIAYVIKRHVEGDERFEEMFARLASRVWVENQWHGWEVIPG